MYLIEDILNEFGVEYEESGNDYLISCIFHEEKNPSFRIDKDSGIWHCFSCDAKGSFFKFVKIISGLNSFDTMMYLSKFVNARKMSRLELYSSFIESISRDYNQDLIDDQSSDVELPKNVKIRCNEYLQNRGFTSEEILKWDMRVCTEFPYKNWILIPIYRNGILQTYFIRSIYDSSKIYGYKTIYLPDGSKKNEGYYRSNILFGMDRCTDFSSPICVGEGIFDSILNGRFISQSVAALSNNLLKEQKEFLRQFKEIIIIPDNDIRGMFLVHTAVPLSVYTNVSVAMLPDKYKDSGETLGMNNIIGESISNRMNLVDFMVSKKYLEFLHYKKYVLNKKS